MQAVTYDLESYPNAFTCAACTFGKPETMHVWEISDRRNDAAALIQWLDALRDHNIPMIGFNNLGYDYQLIHALLTRQAVTAAQLHWITEGVIVRNDIKPHWPSDRLIPQIDLYKVHHFDNKAKRQSLKGLEFNMRSTSIEDLPFPPGQNLTSDQIDTLIVYNKHDVAETDRFALITMPNLQLRQKMLDSGMLSGDVLNFNDTKLGKELLQQRLGRNACYTWESGKREPRQTIRKSIAMRDVIFPRISFQHPDMQRIHDWFLDQTLQPKDFDGVERASTKGVFTDASATINGFQFDFGTGGLHGSVKRKRYVSNETHVIVDADVASMYPAIIIENNLAPEHLSNQFTVEYERLRKERFSYAKGTPENAALKLALNGTYGASNDVYSPLYDPLMTMRTTVNGQLMLCMLAEALMTIPGLEMIQVNTDGMTVYLPRQERPAYDRICKEWEAVTRLELEFAEYERMFIRDVNGYVAVSPNGKLKQKGAYWHPDPDPTRYADSISNAGPSAWHKDLSAPIIPYAAVQAMVHDVPIEQVVYSCTDPFMFAARAKVSGKDKLLLDGVPQQRVLRYYVARDGGSLVKHAPPVAGKRIGAFKKKSGVSDEEYARYPDDVWNEAVHTKNQSTYEDRSMSICSGWKVAECNHIGKFDWVNLNYDYYIQEARKLWID